MNMVEALEQEDTLSNYAKRQLLLVSMHFFFIFVFLFFTNHSNAKCNRVKHLAKTVSSNVLLSDICHIQSPHAFKTVLKTHLYHKFIQILSADLPPPPPPPHLLSLTLYIPSVWGMWGDNMRNTF